MDEEIPGHSSAAIHGVFRHGRIGSPHAEAMLEVSVNARQWVRLSGVLGIAAGACATNRVLIDYDQDAVFVNLRSRH